MDHHESNLYCEASPRAIQILEEYNAEIFAETGFRLSFSKFRDEITGQPWMEVPFMFDPWWEARRR